MKRGNEMESGTIPSSPLPQQQQPLTNKRQAVEHSNGNNTIPKPHKNGDAVDGSSQTSTTIRDTKKFVGCSPFDSFEILEKLGEGTFGEVHKAKSKKTGDMVALKKVLMHKEREGIPITALREIKILKSLNHKNIVPLVDMIVRQPGRGGFSGSGPDNLPAIYMVFPYMEHDLMGLLENKKVTLTMSHIKLYMQQLLEGTAYLHKNNILHRDMKASNLLINNEGRLFIADFGLSRPYNPKDRNNMTAKVVTRWYRPPELLLGELKYTEAIDVWGVGCIFGEMLMEKPLFPGVDDVDQLAVIMKLCGTPDNTVWPGWHKLAYADTISGFKTYKRRVREHFMRFDDHAADLLDKLLVLDPSRRLTAAQALDHPFFQSAPFPAREEDMPKFESSHEYDSRKRKQKHAQPQPAGGGGGGVSPPHAPDTASHGMAPPNRGGGGYGGHSGNIDPYNQRNRHSHHHHRRNDSFNGGDRARYRSHSRGRGPESSPGSSHRYRYQQQQQPPHHHHGNAHPHNYRGYQQGRDGDAGGSHSHRHHRHNERSRYNGQDTARSLSRGRH